MTVKEVKKKISDLRSLFDEHNIGIRGEYEYNTS